jgi:hypothetical protein
VHGDTIDQLVAVGEPLLVELLLKDSRHGRRLDRGGKPVAYGEGPVWAS